MARSARQRAALRKAQLASARKRKGKGKGKLAAAHRRSRRNARIAVGTGLVAGVAVGYAGYASGNRTHRKNMDSANRAIKTIHKQDRQRKALMKRAMVAMNAGAILKHQMRRSKYGTN